MESAIVKKLDLEVLRRIAKEQGEEVVKKIAIYVVVIIKLNVGKQDWSIKLANY